MDENQFKEWQLSREGRGVLTPDDRKYLLGEKEMKSRQSEYNKRSDIRDRIVTALLDFTLIFEGVSDKDLEQVFGTGSANKPGALRLGMRDAIALFYNETGAGKYDFPIEPFDQLLKSAIWRVEGPNTPVSFAVGKREPQSIGRIGSKIFDGKLHELSEEEMRFYIMVQEWAGDPVETGIEAEQQFKENVRKLEKEGRTERIPLDRLKEE